MELETQQIPLAQDGGRSRQIDEFGFIYHYEEADLDLTREAPISPDRYRSLESKWLSLLSSASNVEHLKGRAGRSSRKLKRLCRLGIPDSLRARVWPWLACIEESQAGARGGFAELAVRSAEEIYDVIDRDIERSYPDNIYFQTPKNGEPTPPALDDLRNVLYAFAQHKPTIGYTQGMGRLAGCLLLQMPAELAFWTLVRLVESPWYMAGYYEPGLGRLKINARVFTKLLKKHEPEIARHLESHEIDPMLYLAPWHMSLFTSTLPWKTVLRLWDAFLLDGTKLLFRVSLSILRLMKKDILAASQEETYRLVLHPPLDALSVKALFHDAYRLKIKRSALARLSAAAKDEM